MLVPALAIGGLGLATGGFGLLPGAGASAGAASAASAATAASAAGAGSAAAGAIGASGLGYTAASSVPFAFGTAQAAGAGAAAASAIPSWLTLGNVFSGLGAVSSLAGGVQGMQGAEFLEAQYEEEAANARTAAAQDELQRRRQLNTVLASQRAIFASRGIELFGGSQQAIQEGTKQQAEEDISTSKINILSRARRYGLAGAQAAVQGTGAFLGGVGGAAKSLSGVKV